MIHEVKDIDEGMTWHINAPYLFDSKVPELHSLLSYVFDDVTVRALPPDQGRKIRDSQPLIELICPSTFVKVEKEQFVLKEEVWEGMTEKLFDAFLEEWASSRLVTEENAQLWVVTNAAEKRWPRLRKLG